MPDIVSVPNPVQLHKALIAWALKSGATKSAHSATGAALAPRDNRTT